MRTTCYISAVGIVIIGLMATLHTTQAQQTSPPDAPPPPDQQEQPDATATDQVETPQQPTPQTEAQTEAQTDAQTDAKAKAKTDAKTDAKADAKDDAKDEAQGRGDAQAEGPAKKQSQAQPKGPTEAQVRAETQSQVDAEAEVDATERDRRGQATGGEARDDFGLQINDSEGRLTVQDVESQSALAQAGLRADDEILAVNGQRVSTQAQLNQQLRTSGQGRTMLTVFRDGRMQTIQADMLASASASDRGIPPAPPAPDGERTERAYRGALQPMQKPGGPGPVPPGAQKSHQTAVQKGGYGGGDQATHSHHQRGNRRWRR